MKRMLLVLAVMTGSGCTWLQPKPVAAPVVQAVPDPDVVERDLTQPYAEGDAP